LLQRNKVPVGEAPSFPSETFHRYAAFSLAGG